MTMKRDKIFQRIIRSNLSALCESTDCHSAFLNIFVEKNLLSPTEKEIILGKGPKYEKSSEFYFKIVQKGPSAYKAVVNALRMTDQNYAADILVQNGGILRDDILKFQGNDGISGPVVVADSMDMTQSFVEETSNSLNQLNLSSPLLLAPFKRFPTSPQTNIGHTGPVPFSNVFSSPNLPPNLSANPELDHLAEYLRPYRLQSLPKGYALIINIVSFDYSKDWFRNGANHDTEQLSKLFQDLGFLVYAIEDLTAYHFGIVLEEFKENFKSEPVDCSVVCVMSHGDEGDNIYTRDRAVINVKRDILEKFTNVNCPQLKGKPKLFFFQFCRGDVTDLGTTETDSPTVFSRARSALGEMTRHTTIPTWTDMLVCYSTLEGHYAYRESDAGSWFIQILCETLRMYGHQFDICELLNLVAQIMKTKVGEDGQKQICPYTNIGFTKKLYFNGNT